MFLLKFRTICFRAHCVMITTEIINKLFLTTHCITSPAEITEMLSLRARCVTSPIEIAEQLFLRAHYVTTLTKYMKNYLSEHTASQLLSPRAHCVTYPPRIFQQTFSQPHCVTIPNTISEKTVFRSQLRHNSCHFVSKSCLLELTASHFLSYHLSQKLSLRGHCFTTSAGITEHNLFLKADCVTTPFVLNTVSHSPLRHNPYQNL